MLLVEIARRAQRDLEDNYDYGVETFGLATADAHAADLMHATRLLAEFPEIGEAIRGRSDGIRRLSCIALWNGEGGDERGGTEHMVALVRRMTGHDPGLIDPATL